MKGKSSLLFLFSILEFFFYCKPNHLRSRHETIFFEPLMTLIWFLERRRERKMSVHEIPGSQPMKLVHGLLKLVHVRLAEAHFMDSWQRSWLPPISWAKQPIKLATHSVLQLFQLLHQHFLLNRKLVLVDHLIHQKESV